MATQEEIDVARDTLNRWNFVQIFPGDAAPFNSPGVVLKCKQLTPVPLQSYQVIEMLAATNDAGAVATSLLKQPQHEGITVFAMLAAVPLREHRRVLNDLAPLCG